MHHSMPVHHCPYYWDNGKLCGQRFNVDRLFVAHKRRHHWGRSTLVTPDPGLPSLAIAADVAATTVPAVPTTPQPHPCWDWSTANLPTAAPYMLLDGVPQVGTPAYLCTTHVADDNTRSAGCFAVVVPFKDSTKFHLEPDAVIRAKFGPVCVEQGKQLTAIIRYGDPDIDDVGRALKVLNGTLKTKLHMLTKEVPKGSPLTVHDFISGRCQWDLTRPLQLSTDPETWGIKTKTKTDAMYQAIVTYGFKNADDVPGGANDYLSQPDTVSEAESEDARNGTQTEHNGATMVMGVAGWPGTSYHNDLFGPGKNLVVGAAGCQLLGISYVHLIPRMIAYGWYRSLMEANNDEYLRRVLNDQTPDLVGETVDPGKTKVSSALFPTPCQVANAQIFNLPIHSHTLPPGSSYSLQPDVDHSFSNHRYRDRNTKLLVIPPKLSITYDWMGVDALKPESPPLGLPEDFTYLANTKLDDTVKGAFPRPTALEIKYSHKPVVFDDSSKEVTRAVTLLFPSQLYIATSGIPNSGKGMWVSTTVPVGALICEYTGTLVFAQDTPEGKRRDFPLSPILSDRHTWRLLEQKEWGPACNDTSWFVLAIAAKDHGSGAGYVNSVCWKEGYATDAKAEQLFPQEVDGYEHKINEYLKLKAALKDPNTTHRDAARRALSRLEVPHIPNVRPILLFDHGNGQPRLFWQAIRKLNRCDELLCLAYPPPHRVGDPWEIQWPAVAWSRQSTAVVRKRKRSRR
jgi:hypothetical protein